ncbi:DNA primase, partial [Patescibacteria group bacterium]|nr:DNA primase [Patescibacteria group bacterium]
MEVVDDIKSRLDIADLVGEYLQLKPAGSGSFKACCPFHQEKSPSFFVNRPRQSWHCFGCDQGGDVISFVQQIEGMDFREALELLAQKTGVELPSFDMQKQSDKKRMIEIQTLAAKFFRSQLLNDPGAEIARAYVAKRGLDDLTVDVWKIGYAPDAWSQLSEALAKLGVTDDELIRSGLALKSDRGGVYDRFRGRLMFSIWDIHGNILGFTGRILTESKTESKYVNTPETSIYKKSHVVFGLDKAKGEIKRQNLAVIAEGNMDVISSHQFNVTNVVASSGTALTQDQLGLLKRFTTNLAIAFDADAAGNAATIRGLDLARQLDFNVRIITLPKDAGKDPDEAVRKDPAIWKKAIADALPVIHWLYQNAFRDIDSSTPDGKKRVAQRLIPEFRRIQDPIERDAWLIRLSKDLAVNEDVIRQLVAQRAPLTPEFRVPTPPVSGAPIKEQKPVVEAKTRSEELEERIQAILYLKPALRDLAI